jgi:predicted nucleic acid-binding Zn ribbon protein
MIRRSERIREVLDRELRRLGIWQRLRETDAVAVFAEAVGDEIAKQARAVSIADGRLVIKVPSPVWRQELTFRRRELAEAVNRALGAKVVREIFLTA